MPQIKKPKNGIVGLGEDIGQHNHKMEEIINNKNKKK